MSESDDTSSNRVESSNSARKIIRSQVKKYRLQRSGSSLQITPTEDELNYRKNFEKFNVITAFPGLVCCTKCQISFKSDILKGKEIYSHPLLKVLLCAKCSVFYGDGEFSLDEDDEDKYCRWCGEGGKLFLCSKCICGFCPKCIKKNFGAKKVSEIQKDDDWICYFCNPEPLWKLRNICELAQKQSQSNRNEKNKNAPETPRKIISRRYKDNNQIKEAVISDKDEKDDSKRDSSNGVERKRNTRYSQRRRRYSGPNKSKVSDGDSSSSIQRDDDDEPEVKRRKVTRYMTKVGASFINGNGRRKHAFNKKATTPSSESSSSESPSSESDVYLVKNSNRKLSGMGTGKVEKNKHAEKLKEILNVAEITSDLCFQMCKKELRKLERKNCVVSDEKLISSCEKLKSMSILMSSSLSTVHNMIISLQRKFGAKGLNSVCDGVDVIPLLKTMRHILMEKRLKTSHVVSIVSDILNRYPCIALESKRISDSICHNETGNGEATIGGVKTNEDMENCNLENDLASFGKPESVSPQEVSQNNVALAQKPSCDSDISTDFFEPDNSSLEENDDGALNRVGVKRNCADSGDQSKKDSSPDFDMEVKKIYDNSLKLKEQLLKDSSDETSPNDLEISDSSIADISRDGRTDKIRDNKERGRAKAKMLTKEQREINRLTNLNSLDRRLKSHDSDSETSSEKSSTIQRQTRKKNKEVYEEESSSDRVSLKSESDTLSSERVQLPSHQDEVDFLKQCSSMLKEYILKSTSSESEIEEEEENTSKSAKENYPFKNKSERSGTAEDFEVSTSEVSSYELKSEWEKSKGEPKRKLDSSGESTDSFVLFKPRKKRKSRKFTTSTTESCDSDVIVEASPTKGRKTIRKILKTGSLQLGTRQAIKVENERKKRMAERNECYTKFFPNMLESDRLVLDFDRETGEVLLEVPKVLVKNLKPHQKEGVKFMWDNCFESLTSLEESNGSGCILAHCMGLGKTLQIIALLATVMNNNLGVDTALILCPLNVVNNWVNEFELWLKDVDFDIDIYNIIGCKKRYERCSRIRQWHREGGIMILSYDMMRSLTNIVKSSKRETDSAAIISELLLDPGPNIIVCDEGHVLKNEDTSLARCLKRVSTARRIVLTGTPFQNNLLEYHSMVQFIKPNVLGTRKEFMNRFANPIRNGQFEDSTPLDVKLMRARAHVLHKLLDGCIQRFSYSVLTPFLPEKHEYVITIRLTETQAKLYQYYTDKCRALPLKDKGTKLFRDFQWLQKIWAHPRIVTSYMEEREEKSGGSESSSDESIICMEPDSSEKPYWKQVIKPEENEEISSSGKLVILFDILHHCRKLGEKVLLFSQSLKNLDLIEFFLHKVHMANQSKNDGKDCGGIPSEYLDTWVEGKDYFRMDGSTDGDTRSKRCKWFNSKKNSRMRLFLISTKAGGLGINLVGANRVVIFDASWNPSHDVQSIFRVYRFGQSKTCYIYRLVAEATMEEKIYERQVTKLSLEKRVLDEHQIERHYTMGNFQALYKYDPLPRSQWTVPILPKDMLLAEILNVRREVIVTYHEHDSLLENKEEEEMTEEERKAAWEDFEKERFMMENQLERRAFPVAKDTPSTDELTQDVLRLAGMYKASGSDVPYFTPSVRDGSDGSLPFRIVNVHSLVGDSPGASSIGGSTFRNSVNFSKQTQPL